jgi:hypothetical protein
VRNHVGGGTIGGPILKDKLFTFFTFEKWKNRQPYTKVMTLPTDLERQGDFSRTLTKTGALRTIFDPYTTQTNAATKYRDPAAICRQSRPAFPDGSHLPAVPQ